MEPKFNTGTKVRVRIKDESRYFAYPDLKRFDNLTGTVINCRTVLGYPAYSAGSEEPSSGPNIRVHVYTVQVEGGFLLAGLVEESLEEHLHD